MSVRIAVGEGSCGLAAGAGAVYAALEEYGPCPLHRMSFLKKFYAAR